MIPDVDLQLTVVMRALKGVVWDSVPSENISARENLGASIATLEFVLKRHSSHFSRAAAELGNAIELAERVATIVADNELVQALDEAKSVAKGTAIDLRSFDQCRARLSSAVCDVFERTGDSTGKHRITEAVILASNGQLALARAWCLPAGFEVDPKRIPSLEDVLGRRRERDSPPLEADTQHVTNVPAR